MKKPFTLILILSANSSFAQPCIANTNSLQFDGFNSYVSILNQTGLDLSSSVTVEAWVYSTAWGFTSAQNSIACKHGWSQGEGGYVLRAGGTGELSFNIGGLDTNGNNMSWQEVISPVSALALNTWYHVAGTYDGVELKCYINGVLQNTRAFTGSIVPSPGYPLTIGRLSDPAQFPERYWSGSLDEIRIWNRALSDAEILSSMNDHIDPISVTGLVSYWRFNEGAGTLVADLQSGNNGTCNNNTWDVSVPFNTVPPVPTITYNLGILTSSAAIGNQWYLSGVPILGEVQNTFTPSLNGDYTVTVTNGFGCSATSSIYTVTDVGINESGKESTFSISPNPVASGTAIKVTLKGEMAGMKLSMYNPLSERVMYIDLSGIRENQIELDRQGINNGIYILSLYNDTRVIYRCKLILQ